MTSANNEPVFGYATAKIIILGDPGVGKSELGQKLARNKLSETTNQKQNFWIIEDFSTVLDDGTECQAILWDLVGTPIYHPIHPILVDDVDVALILFDPTNRQNTLTSAEFWIKQLSINKELPPCILVGARIDRGRLVISKDEIIQFCELHGISGKYIGTSATTGEGIDELRKMLGAQITWETVKDNTKIKEYNIIKKTVLELKDISSPTQALIDLVELQNSIRNNNRTTELSYSDILNSIKHLRKHGYVEILETPLGASLVLLKPESLIDICSSIILFAGKHPRGLGALSETKLLDGEFVFPELTSIDLEQQKMLIQDSIVRLLKHNICFREKLGSEDLIIFPSLIRQKRPPVDETVYDDITYLVRGNIKDIYSALVVLLGYTPSFTRVNQWQNQAQYQIKDNEICGFRLAAEEENEIELVLYYGPTMPPYGRGLFQNLFESFLYKPGLEVLSLPPIFCPKNGHQIDRTIMVNRIRDKKSFVFCDECGDKTLLPSVTPEILGGKITDATRRDSKLAELRNLYEANLTRIKGFRHVGTSPRCYISHADDHLAWVETLISDIDKAGINVNVDVSQIQKNDFVLPICTPSYKQAWETSSPRMVHDAQLIQSRLQAYTQSQPRVIPILFEGNIRDATPKELLGYKAADFRTEDYYLVSLFDLVLSLHSIPLNHVAFGTSRTILRKQWKETLNQQQPNNQELFISYAWGKEDEEREAIVNELDKEFQRRSVTIIRDKRDLGFKGRIKEFMETIGQGKAVILVISEKYLKSPNCCFELVQIAKHGNFADRVFPIVLPDANIYDPVSRIRYVEHWEKKKDELDEVMKTVSAANLEGFREDVDLYTEIRALLPRLMDILKDMNTLTPDLHKQSSFSEIFNAVMTKLEE